MTYASGARKTDATELAPAAVKKHGLNRAALRYAWDVKPMNRKAKKIQKIALISNYPGIPDSST